MSGCECAITDLCCLCQWDNVDTVKVDESEKEKKRKKKKDKKKHKKVESESDDEKEGPTQAMAVESNDTAKLEELAKVIQK